MRTPPPTSRLLLAAMIPAVLATLACKDSVTPRHSGGTAALTGAELDPSIGQITFSTEVCGVIPATLVITENTRLTCDVQCLSTTGPCIQFGRDNITLFLNGFTMTGAASPPTGCAPAPTPAYPYDGISTAGFDHVRIRGPGMVQAFRRHGIFMFATSDAIVENVTSHYNCFSGILMSGSNENLLSENVSVRNSSASGGAPCGGTCIVNSNGNRVRRNHFYGNGSVAPGAPLGSPNDFGVGLVGTSSDNVVEENSMAGNINGVLLFPATAGNMIRRNVIAGNPPVQVAVTAGTPVGADIRDASAPGANTFRENHCITYEGTTLPAPCPSFPRARGHY